MNGGTGANGLYTTLEMYNIEEVPAAAASDGPAERAHARVMLALTRYWD